MTNHTDVVTTFSDEIVAWQQRHGRHDLPWQGTRDPYRIWVSEIMLQQTQVSTVIPYFERFVARFPDVGALAQATQEEVLTLWSGLGYYARGRNLHRAACVMRDEFDGRFPSTLEEVMSLPGVGRSTAGAICVFAYGQIHPILDGNVKRVLSRVLGIEGFPGERAVEERLWSEARSLLPSTDIEAYTQGLMDLGASLCARNRPRCNVCPLVQRCVASRDGRVAELPGRKPRKVLPQRRTRMLMFWDGHQVLLERRPPAGIWGGMWCFPEISSSEQAEDPALLRRFGVSKACLSTLDPLEHGFTHFKLTIEPLLVRVAGATLSLGEPGVIWLSLQDALQAALPTPVRELLRRLDGLQP